MEFKEVFKMADETYDKIQYLYRRVSPALMTLTGTVGTALNWEPTALVLTIWGALHLATGQILSIASDEYKKEHM